VTRSRSGTRNRRVPYYIVSLGCSKNLTDSERINAALINEGFIPAESEHNASLIIINTCGFISDAKKESIGVILDAIELRDSNKGRYRDRKVVVTGCLSQRYPDEMKAEMPEIDLLYGKPDALFIQRCAELFDPQQVTVSDMSGRMPLESNRAYEYIKISDGCSNNCSYCAIPIIRGPIVSFSPESILADAQSAQLRGARELVIIAQDIAAYNYKGYHLADLLSDLGSIDVPWIRLLYCHPDHLDDRIVQSIRDIPGIVHYIDLPFQHADRSILSAMNREGDAEKYLSLVSNLRKEIPDIAIRSTFMTGFPGETDEAFNDLLSFVGQAKLDRVGCFAYSPEEGTSSAGFDDMPAGIKEDRRERLMELQREISREKLEAKIGSRCRVLVEEKIEENEWIGRSEFDAPEVDGVFFLTATGLHLHDMVSAEITDTIDHDLAGVI
jgi:ribosomal protein S12 methylthiotransferase